MNADKKGDHGALFGAGWWPERPVGAAPPNYSSTTSCSAVPTTAFQLVWFTSIDLQPYRYLGTRRNSQPNIHKGSGGGCRGIKRKVWESARGKSQERSWLLPRKGLPESEDIESKCGWVTQDASRVHADIAKGEGASKGKDSFNTTVSACWDGWFVSKYDCAVWKLRNLTSMALVTTGFSRRRLRSCKRVAFADRFKYVCDNL